MELAPWGESTFRAIRLGASACLGIGLGLWGSWIPIGWNLLHSLSLTIAVVIGMLINGSVHGIAYQVRNLPGILCWISLTTGLGSLQGPALPEASSMFASPAPSGLLGSDLLLVQVFRQDSPTRYRAVMYRRMVNSMPDRRWHAYSMGSEILLSLPYSPQPRDAMEKSLPKVGDHLLTEATHLRSIMGPKNPGQGDLRDYYQSQGLGFELNLNQGGAYRILNQDKYRMSSVRWDDQSFKVRFGRWQSHWSHRMDLNISDSVGRALSKALLLGWRVDLSQELQDGFRNSGTVHLLAVSGMHVLFIYKILQWIMRGLYLILVAFQRQSGLVHKPPKWLIFIVLSSLILAYALLTGGAPSAMRAAMVVIWMDWSAMLYGNRNASSALLLIAILLIIIEPFSWKDPGFQLSFGAVGGLLWLYAPLWKLARMDQRALAIRYPASLVGMSLVTQVVTAPLCWFHFGQFPNYFLLANLVLVPLSSPLLILAIVWTLVGSSLFVGKVLAWFGEFLFGIAAQWTSTIGNWPEAVSYHWDFNGSDLALSFTMLGILMMGLHCGTSFRKSHKRRKMFHQLAVILWCGWMLGIAHRNVRWFQEGMTPECVVFGLSSGNCLVVRDGSGLLWSGDRSGLTDRRPVQWIRRKSRLSDHPMAFTDTGPSCRLLQWNMSVTLIAGVKDTFKLRPTRSGPLRLLHAYGNKHFRLNQKVDIIVLGPLTRMQWPKSQSPSHLILTGGHSQEYRRFIASLCLRQGIVFCDLNHSILPDYKVISPYPLPNWSL
ncbi:MAG: ComEC/Rec2 family competence protein [Sphingomonadales bacterium]|nr:ComEC/Rec2 family competence protein [Sphingomonadales bacterium]